MKVKAQRKFLRFAGVGAAGVVTALAPSMGEYAKGQGVLSSSEGIPEAFDVRAYGAKGDGITVDSQAINRAIEAAEARGGVRYAFPQGSIFATRFASRAMWRCFWIKGQ